MAGLTTSMKFDSSQFDKFAGQAKAKVKRDVLRLLLAEAEAIMTDAKLRTPVDTGTLRASGTVKSDLRMVANPKAELSFGGAAAGYALIVHERMDVYHPVGEAKFLENAMHEWESSGGWQRLGRAIGGMF